ncbi:MULTISPECIES: DMT family transporter [Pseudoalteromonas]|uniref:Membrane protein n=1 Tax=Pseudoalteromonas atlantica TaxID=288 RepID=A0ABQ0U8E6_PSEAF|nr:MULTISPECIES: DMT family transporter [unclassified Pseudoalteromonas]MAJ40516.1 EamA/RhaT family transporter [Pseudoalteromonadaceae bacterium]OUX87008.1 MAG: EamA family transporter [Pseudoalteromonas sp. TMED43]GEK74776.1 membrane protein [Pseudoalteromonas atlantica]KPV92451.1 EamA-like transporter family protein [Pseudoalteromonas sp. P1-30]KPW03136.1 EamA-like transporter family protein [Pseudoalteromonas sp. P1-11]
MKATLYTLVALIAFAANSLLCRMALAQGYIDAWNFTIIRLVSGAVCLGLIMAVYTYNLKRKGALNDAILSDTGSWRSSISLLVYALCFSIAYIELDTGTGALILFSAVQLTMIGWGIYKKEQLSKLQWGAFFVALAGFVYLMLPSAAVPSLLGASLMALSGVAWGVYSIRGKACVSPLRTTAFNFIRSLVAIPVLLLVAIGYLKTVSMQGVLLACASGAIASGIGYSIWYVAMPLLKSTQAAVVQLCVPVLAAIAGMLFLSEQVTVEFIIASSLILGSVLVFILNKHTAR